MDLLTRQSIRRTRNLLDDLDRIGSDEAPSQAIGFIGMPQCDIARYSLLDVRRKGGVPMFEPFKLVNNQLPVNDSRLLKPTTCRVLKSFCVGGRPLEVGAVVVLPFHDAASMRALGRVELV